MRKRYILLLIIIIACLTRLFFLGDYPKGFSGDEAQQGYSAYSILKTGKDEWGQFLPLNPRGFGDFKPPLYTYVAIPFIAIFGLNESAVRLPAATVGVLTVLVLYFLTLQMLKDEKIALWSTFILSISPWHIQLSRTAFEGGLGILLFSLGLLFFLKGLEKSKYFIFTGILWALTFYTYHSFKLFTVLFIISLSLIFYKKLNWQKILPAILIFIFFLLPLILNLKTSFIRSADVGIFSKQQLQGYFENKGVSPLPLLIDKLFDNKFYFIIAKFSDNYLSYYSPPFFFTGARPDNSYLNFPMFPLLYISELFFWLITTYLLVKKKIENHILILWLMIAAIPASLTVGSMNANRAITFLPIVSIISGIGAKNLVDTLNNKFNLQKINITKILVLLLLLSFMHLIYFYLIQLPKKNPESLRQEYKLIFEKILQIQNGYDQIIISKAFTQPQIFIAFYSKMEPSFFQDSSRDWLRYEKSNKFYIDQLESWNLGKFYFEDIKWDNKESKRENALVVAKAEDFPADVISILDVFDKKGDIAYRLVPVNH